MLLKTQTEQRTTRYNNNSPREPSVTITDSFQPELANSRRWRSVVNCGWFKLFSYVTSFGHVYGSISSCLFVVFKSKPIKYQFWRLPDVLFHVILSIIFVFTGIFLFFFIYFSCGLYMSIGETLIFFRATKIKNLMISYPIIRQNYIATVIHNHCYNESIITVKLYFNINTVTLL